MNPALHYQVTQARVADRHAQARRDALARHCPPGTACATAPAQASRARVPSPYHAPDAHRPGRPQPLTHPAPHPLPTDGPSTRAAPAPAPASARARGQLPAHIPHHRRTT